MSGVINLATRANGPCRGSLPSLIDRRDQDGEAIRQVWRAVKFVEGERELVNLKAAERMTNAIRGYCPPRDGKIASRAQLESLALVRCGAHLLVAGRDLASV